MHKKKTKLRFFIIIRRNKNKIVQYFGTFFVFIAYYCMKIKGTIFVWILFILVMQDAHPNIAEKNFDEWISLYSNEFCKKMTSCYETIFEDLAAEIRKKALKSVPDQKQCTQNMITRLSVSESEKITLQTEETKLAEKCIEEIRQMSCSDMKGINNLNSISSCKTLKDIFDTKIRK